MTKGSAPFHADRRGFHLSLDAVPAWVCAQCGEACFEEAQVSAIQRMLQAVEEQSLKLAAV